MVKESDTLLDEILSVDAEAKVEKATPAPGPGRPVRRDMVLPQGRSLRVVTENGEPLLEITNTETGSELRLLCGDTAIAVTGDLAIEADSIRLKARKGKVEVNAEEDDVLVEGKNIYLN